MTTPFSMPNGEGIPSATRFDCLLEVATEFYNKSSLPFFHKTVTRSMVMALVSGPWGFNMEIPFKFVENHGSKFYEDVTFTLEGEPANVWLIRLTVTKFFKHLKRCRVFAYGLGGLKTFTLDTNIRVGDHLFFSLRATSEFYVRILRNPSIVQSPTCKTCGFAPHYPRFVVNVIQWHLSLNPGHVNRDDMMTLRIPGRFWDSKNSRMIHGDEVYLLGPKNMALMAVKLERTVQILEDSTELKVTTRLASRWETFVVTDQLCAGDILEFTLINPNMFRVDVLDRV